MNYTINCNSLGKKEVHINLWYIELISKDEKPFYGIPSYYLTVKAKCQFGSVVIGVQNFYECLVISAI